MDKNLNLAAQELFSKLRSQFSKISLKNEAGEPTDEEELARQFDFDFEKNNVSLGSIRIDLTDDDGLTVMFSNDVVKKQPSNVKKVWFNFIEELRKFAKQKVLNFEIRDLNLTNIQKRGDSQMMESKLQGTLKTSYQDLGEAKLIIKHNQPINPDIPAGRTMHIESIYIENAAGERFKYPMRHINGARAMAEHIKHGGIPYDDIGQYIISLSEELSNLRKFKNYVNRSSTISEAMSDISGKVVERIEEVKKEITQLQKSSYYESFTESFTKHESQEIPDEIINDWVDRLTIKTFNEELKGVFPYIYKLVGQEVSPVKEMNFEDFDTFENDEIEVADKTELLSFEELQFEKHLNRIIGEGPDIFSNNQEEQSVAIEKLNGLLAQEFPVGTDGTNAIESLSDVIDDKELTDVFKELADINPNSDVRSIIKDYISIKDEENGTDVLSKLNFEAEPAAEPAAEPQAAPAAEPAAAPAPVPAAEPAAAPAPAAPGIAMAENIRNVIERAKQAGMTAEDTFTLFGQEITLADAIQKIGLNVNEFFDQGYESTGDEVVEFVRSMFDEETGRFPKGETGVLLSVEKKFGEEAIEKANHLVNELTSSAQLKRIQELSGMSQAQEGAVDDLAFGAGKFAGKVQKGATNAMSKLRQGMSDIASNFQSGRDAGMSDLPQGQSGQPVPGPKMAKPTQPASPQPNPRTMTPPTSGERGPKPSQPMPNQGQGTQPAPGQQFPLNQPALVTPAKVPAARKGQAAREDLDAMLRIAGLR
jgi:hypothetical protein